MKRGAKLAPFFVPVPLTPFQGIWSAMPEFYSGVPICYIVSFYLINKKIMEKLPLKKYKAILEKGCLKYTDDEVLSTIEFLFLIAGMDYEIYSKRQKRELEFKKLKELEKTEIL